MTMESIKAFFEAILQMLFGKLPEKEEVQKTLVAIDAIPRFGDQGKDVQLLQAALNEHGASPKLKVDGDFGENTKAAISVFQKSKGLEGTGNPGPQTIAHLGLVVKEAAPLVPAKPTTPTKKSGRAWFWKMKEFEGVHESDAAFQARMNPIWKKTGLSFTGLVGSARAWCGLALAAGLIWTGLESDVPKNAFRAMAWDLMETKINWKVDGIPQAAFVRLKSASGSCTTTANNHVTMANGDCAAHDIIEMSKGADGVWRPSSSPAKIKPNAVFSGFGGNQGDRLKVSNYAVSRICSVTWPKSQALPGKVTKSVNCSNGKTADTESTR